MLARWIRRLLHPMVRCILGKWIKMVNTTVVGYWYFRMEQNTWVNFRMELVSAKTVGLILRVSDTVDGIRELLYWMDTVFRCIQMVVAMLDNGKMVCQMDMVHGFMEMDRWRLVNGYRMCFRLFNSVPRIPFSRLWGHDQSHEYHSENLLVTTAI